jgi:sugar lactone lactonase YvrE
MYVKAPERILIAAALVAAVLVGSSVAFRSRLPVSRSALRPIIQQASSSPYELSFTLRESTMTSAGIFNRAGHLIRTLWGNERLAAGHYDRPWDGNDDFGKPANAGPFTAKLLAHNVQITWNGVIGNSSSHMTGTEKLRGLGAFADVACTGPRVYLLRDYMENLEQVTSFAAADPTVFRSETSSFPSLNQFSAISMATDGERMYVGCTRSGIYRTNYNSFVFAYPLTDRSKPYTFSGVPPVKGYDAAENNDGQWIVTGTGNQCEVDNPTSLAVQKHGKLLAVAEIGEGRVVFFDKLTGQHEAIDPIPMMDVTCVRWSQDDSTLWVAASGDVQAYRWVNGAWSKGTTISNDQPVKAFAVNPNDGSLAILYGGTDQQLRAFSPHGKLIYAIGQKGGYASDPTVQPDKFMILDGSPKFTAMGGGVAFEPTGKLWIIDSGNQRAIRFNTDHAYDTQVRMVTGYSVTVDPKDTSRVFANGYLEFERDWNVPLRPGLDQGWKLVRNWGYGFVSFRLPARTTDGLTHVVTASNGKTYGVLEAASQPGRQIVELAATGLRPIGPFADTYLASDMSAWSFQSKMHAGQETMLRRPLSGFEGDNPRWGDARPYCSVPLGHGLPAYQGGRCPTGGMPLEPMADGSLVSSNTDTPGDTGTYFLGIVKKGANDYDIETARGEVGGPLPTDGGVPLDPGGSTRCIPSLGARSLGDYIAIFCNGEFYDQAQSNQILFYHRCGLPLGRFGDRNGGTNSTAASGRSGNFYGNAMVMAPDGSLRILHSDEWNHGGIHEVEVSHLDSVKVLDARFDNQGKASFGELVANGSSPVDPFANGKTTFDKWDRAQLGQEWTDPNDKFLLSNGVLKMNAKSYNDSFSSVLLRPEPDRGSRQTVQIPAQFFDDSKMFVGNAGRHGEWGLVSRYQPDGSRYYAFARYIRFDRASANVNGFFEVAMGLYKGKAQWGMAYDRCFFLPEPPGHGYSLAFSTVGSSPTTLQAVFTDTTARKVIVTLDQVCDESGLQRPGKIGIMGAYSNNEFGPYQLEQATH